MHADRTGISPLQAPLSKLERELIDEYLRTRGYDPVRLPDLPEEDRTALLKDASMYASGKLAEVESRLHFLDEIHDGTPDTHKPGL